MTVGRPLRQGAPASSVSAGAGIRRWVSFGVGVAGGTVGALLGGVVTVRALDRLTNVRRGTIHSTANLVNLSVAVVGVAIYELHGGHLDPAAGAGLMARGR